MGFIKTDTILDRILARTLEDLSGRRRALPLEAVRGAALAAPPSRDFSAALRRADVVALIAEVKRASPSKGVLITDFDPAALGRLYAAHGAAAISVLTDEPFFQGHLDHLRAVRSAVDVPVLRKDFILDVYQVYEARAAGADAILLIAAALDDVQLRDLHDLAHELGLAALVEVHQEAEVERALRAGAAIIGVNNRDLKTFREDLQTTARLARFIPAAVTLVAESAIRSPADVERMGSCGAHAVLVGEGLVKSADMAAAVRAFSQQPRRPAQPSVPDAVS